MDWNGDGLKDLLVGEYNGNIRYFQNVGSVGNPSLHYIGLLQAGGVTLDVGDYSTVWTDDWNEDGLVDVIAGASDGFIRYYRNTGTPTSPVLAAALNLTLASGGSIDVGSRSAPSITDYNGDNIKDLVSGEIGGKVYFYENNGTNANPQLANGVYLMMGTQQVAMAGTSRPTPIDWDNDGDKDLVIGSYDALVRRYMQVVTTPAAPTCDITNIGSSSIPAAGGRVQYSLSFTNLNNTTVVFDAWTKLKNPNGTWTGPLINRSDISLSPGGSLTRNTWMNVPASWASGYYYLYLWVGDYQANQIYDDDYMYFYKSASGDGAGQEVREFAFDPWGDDARPDLLPRLPEVISMGASPNPFNPTTTLEFALPEAAQVKVDIFDSAGRKVGTLVNGWRNAGQHQATWDASNVPSGVYLVRLEAGSMKSTSKILLVK